MQVLIRLSSFFFVFYVFFVSLPLLLITKTGTIIEGLTDYGVDSTYGACHVGLVLSSVFLIFLFILFLSYFYSYFQSYFIFIYIYIYIFLLIEYLIRPFCLTMGLLDVLKRTENSRVVFVSSEVSRQGKERATSPCFPSPMLIFPFYLFFTFLFFSFLFFSFLTAKGLPWDRIRSKIPLGITTGIGNIKLLPLALPLSLQKFNNICRGLLIFKTVECNGGKNPCKEDEGGRRRREQPFGLLSSPWCGRHRHLASDAIPFDLHHQEVHGMSEEMKMRRGRRRGEEGDEKVKGKKTR